MASEARNPFRFGDLALDDGFTNRERELAELKADIRNGQNVVVFAPRRYGKSSLVWRASQELVQGDEALVAQVDLMRATTKEQLAAKLAQAIHDEIATPLFRARERAAQIFRSLRVAPVITVDPADGSLGFAFRAGAPKGDVDATLERLLELPAELAGERAKRVAIVFDEFQEVVALDPALPSLMRAVFQTQPDVAHVYLGSKRSLMEEIFNDANEPFWRSARQMELGPIPRPEFARFIRARFDATGRPVADADIERVLDITRGHPYATQELCYALWEEPAGDVGAALAAVLRSENAHFSLVWDQASRVQRLVLEALAREPAESITASEYRARYGLPTSSSVQTALEALVGDEVVAKIRRGQYRIAEPFLAEWILANAV
jgi:AAA+ ATPase superfamily predicted ATPase